MAWHEDVEVSTNLEETPYTLGTSLRRPTNLGTRKGSTRRTLYSILSRIKTAKLAYLLR